MSAPGGARRTVSLRAGLATALLALAVLAAVVLAWGLSAAHARGQVHVLLDSAPLECDETEILVEPVGTAYGGSAAVPLAKVAEPMRCVLRFRVENRGWATAHVRQVSVPLMGLQSADGVYAASLDGVTNGPLEGRDARFVLQPPRRVPAAGSVDFTLQIRFRPGGCLAPQTMVHYSDQPTLRVRVLGLSGDRTYVGESFGFIGTEASDCSTD